MGWPKALNVLAGLEQYYYYNVTWWVRDDGDREKKVQRVEQGAGEQRMQYLITGLTCDILYTIRVKPYRERKGERPEGGESIDITFKTYCIGMLT